MLINNLFYALTHYAKMATEDKKRGSKIRNLYESEVRILQKSEAATHIRI